MRSIMCQIWTLVALFGIILSILQYMDFQEQKEKDKKLNHKVKKSQNKRKRYILNGLILFSILIMCISFTINSISHKVENAIGVKANNVRHSLQEEDLNVKIIPDGADEMELVKYQEPKAGTYVAVGSTVTLYLDDSYLQEQDTQYNTKSMPSFNSYIIAQILCTQITLDQGKEYFSSAVANNTIGQNDKFISSEAYDQFNTLPENQQKLLKQLINQIIANDEEMYRTLNTLWKYSKSAPDYFRTVYEKYKIECGIAFCDDPLMYIEIRPESGICYYCELWGNEKIYVTGECKNWNWNGEYQGIFGDFVYTGTAKQGRLDGAVYVTDADGYTNKEMYREGREISSQGLTAGTEIQTPIFTGYDSEDDFLESVLWD